MQHTSDFIGKVVTVKVDRPLGSKHPEYGLIYTLNYGYVPGVMAPDGEELDAYILGVFEPLRDFEGDCIAVIHRLDDDDDKLVIVPKGKYYTDEQIQGVLGGNLMRVFRGAEAVAAKQSKKNTAQ